MDKELKKAKRRLFWYKIKHSPLTIIVSIGTFFAVVVGCILIGWSIAGKDIAEVVKSPLAYLWYFIAGATAFIGICVIQLQKNKGKKG